jgi:aldose 1-epimerase
MAWPGSGLDGAVQQRHRGRTAYTHSPDAHWPFAFALRQRFVLTPVRWRCTWPPTRRRAAAHGPGLAPVFPKRSRSRLHVELTERWDNDASGLPTRHVPQPGIDGDVANLAFDNCFEGWRGAARIRDEKMSLR